MNRLLRPLASVVMIALLALLLPAAVLAAPPIAGDDVATVAEDSGPTTIDVLANDDDEDLDAKSIVAIDAIRPTARSWWPATA